GVDQRLFERLGYLRAKISGSCQKVVRTTKATGSPHTERYIKLQQHQLWIMETQNTGTSVTYKKNPEEFLTWYQSYSAHRPLIHKHIPNRNTSSKVLVVGCGNSGTLDSLMCGTSGPLSATRMLGEVCRLPP
ncbi:hypothetical protein GIB67_040037, partial [Kingdonia uniflora]